MNTPHVCDGVDKMAAMSVGQLLAVVLRGLVEDEPKCSCTAPIFHGGDLRCGCCLLRNESQEDAYMARINGPHPFEEDGPGGLCSTCVYPESDPRHAEVPA